MKKELNISKYGYYKVAAVSPKLFLAKPLKNALEIIEQVKQANKNEAMISVFPELSLTGYTCEDLFHNQDLLNEVLESIELIKTKTSKINTVLVIGAPYQSTDGKLYNCAFVLFKGKILGIIPKIHRPNYGEFYEKRWFTSGFNTYEKVQIGEEEVLLTPFQTFKINNEIILGIEICEDLWAPNPPSVNLALNGANVILNLSASNELIGKSDYRKELIKNQSARLNCAYIYSSAGALESTKDVVFGGHCLIAENGSLLAESDKYSFESKITYADIDINKLALERRKNSTFTHSQPLQKVENHKITMEYRLSELSRKYSKNPFVPQDEGQLFKRAQEIFNIQSTGLARRLISVGNTTKIVLGLSGGLDSTLALLVALEAMKKLNRNPRDIITISMPGFGTSARTKEQAKTLAEVCGTTFQEISIVDSVRAHFKAIGHNESSHDVVYENTQARERTQILFNKANQVGGIVLGTGDLSELALGWCTYNGDHMSNYNVNASIPKTLVKYLVKSYANKSESSLKIVLDAIVSTKISPELLPTNKKGEIVQETENILGPYEAHDFFIFHYLRNNFSKEKILFLAIQVFKGIYSKEDIVKWFKVFSKRIHNQQFKRTTLPPGPKVGSVSLSPRGDWRMPDEVKDDE